MFCSTASINGYLAHLWLESPGKDATHTTFHPLWLSPDRDLGIYVRLCAVLVILTNIALLTVAHDQPEKSQGGAILYSL